MLKYTKTILLLSAIFLLSGCTDSDSPIERIANAVGVSADGKVPPVFLRICNWSRLEPSIYTGNTVALSKSQYLWAYLSDGSDFIDPSAIYFNNQPLRKLEKGQYEFYKHYLGNTEGSSQTTCLTIAGLDGESYNIIGNAHDEIVFRNIDYGDTLDLSKGITIEYSSPRHGNENVLIDMQYDYFDADGKLRYYRQRLHVKDNHGSVHVPENMLKSLPMPAEGARLPFCTIELNRKISSIENVKSADNNNMLVGKVYEASLVTHVYIKRSN